MTGTLPQIDFQSLPVAEATRLINETTLLVIMLETPQAIDNVEEIAAVPGIDVLLIGTNDLCMEMGIPGQVDDPRIAEIYQRVIAACRANGLYAGLGGVYEPNLMQRYIALGMQFVLVGSDLSLLMAAARERVQRLRN